MTDFSCVANDLQKQIYKGEIALYKQVCFSHNVFTVQANLILMPFYDS